MLGVMLWALALLGQNTVIDIGFEMTRVTCEAACECDPDGRYVCGCQCIYRKPEPVVGMIYWSVCLRGPFDKFLAADAWVIVWGAYPAWSFTIVPGLPYHDEVCRPYDRDGDGDVDVRDWWKRLNE